MFFFFITGNDGLFSLENALQAMEIDKNSIVYNDDETLSGMIMDVEAQKIITSLEHEDNALDVNQNLNNSIIIAL